MENNKVTTVIPQSLANASASFVEFIKAYYEYMNKEGMPSHMLTNSVASRDVFKATNVYLDVLYNQLGSSWIDNREGDRANIISHLNEIYKTRGSINSIKILFRALYGEEVEVKLPKDFIFKPSSGNWSQEYSVIVQLNDGDITKVSGEFVQVTTSFPGAPDQVFDVEIKRIEVRNNENNIYELFISRYYTGFFYKNSALSYQDVSMTLIESLSSTVAVPVGGTSFRIGDSYDIPHIQTNLVASYIQGLGDSDYTPIANLFSAKTFNRWYIVDSALARNKLETVERQNYTNGTQVEIISRDDVTKTVIIRGQQKITQDNFVNGTSLNKIEEYPQGQSPLDITINWDYIIEEMIKSVRESTGDLNTLINEIPAGESFARGDINNDGVIDISDIEIIVRRSLGFIVDSDHLAWIETHLQSEILNQGLGQTFSYGDGLGLKVRVISTDQAGGIDQIRIVSFGYNYPDVYTTFIQPYDDNGAAAQLIFATRPVGVTAAEYIDRQGFSSDIIKIYDNDYYQEFSYAVASSLNPSVAEDAIKKTVHPAGMKLFTEQVITEIFDVGNITAVTDHHLADDVYIADIFNHLAFELTHISDSVNKYIQKNLAEDLGITDLQYKTYVLGERVENMSVTDSAQVVSQALYVDSGYFYEDFDYVTFYLASIQIT